MEERKRPLAIEIISQENLAGVSDVDEYLYHVTSLPRAQSIVRAGFQENPDQGFGPRLVGQAGVYSAYSAGKTFFTAAEGLRFWISRVEDHLFDQFDDPPPVAVLRIPTVELQEHLEVDELGTDDARAPAYFVPTEALEGRRPLTSLDLRVIHRGYHRGQHDGSVVAYDDEGEELGYLDYSLYEDELLVEIVNVYPEFRRLGIATAMYERMLEEHPDATLRRATGTDDGIAFRKAFDDKHRDRLSPPEPPRPKPFSEEEWGKITAEHVVASQRGRRL